MNLLDKIMVEKAYAVQLNFSNLDNVTIKKIITGFNDPTKHEVNDIYLTVVTIIQYILTFAGVIAFVMILWASVQYLTSFGDESKIESAKKTLIWSIAGIFLIAFAKGIMLVISATFN